MADRKITELSLADSTDISSSNAVLHLVNPDRVLDVDKNRKLTLVDNVVLTSGNQTIDGTKTFSSTITGDISGDATTLGGNAVSYFSQAGTGGTNSVTSLDSRSVNDTPTSRDKGFYVDFKSNITNGLPDGGTYNGQLTFRSYGAGTDISGGAPAQLAYTANNNWWTRFGTSTTAWSSWYKIWHSGNDGSGSGLDADTVDGIQGGSFVRSDADDNKTGFLEMQDNAQLNWGNEADYVSYFSGTHQYFLSRNHAGGDVYFQAEDTSGVNHAMLYMYAANAAPYVVLYGDGTERLRTTTAGIDVSGGVYVDDYLRHNGDTDNYMGFNTTDSQVFVTGNATRLTINNSVLSAGRNLDMNNYDIVGADQIVHEGDTNTYIQFHAADQWRVVTGGTERLEVNNTRTTMQNAQVTGVFILPVF